MNPYRLNQSWGRNETSPGGNRGSTVTGTMPRESGEKQVWTSFSHRLLRLSRETCAMSITHNCGRPEGRAHRDKIARWIIPKLAPGCRVPSANWMARFLGISSSEGGRQIRRALDEAGIATETRGVGRGRRIYVVSLGERQ
jgi:hypothetical protein